MKMHLLNQKEEKLFQRKEVNFKVDFEKVTPSKEELRKSISEHLKLDPELVKIEKADQKFGERSANVSALVYDNKEIMKKVGILPHKDKFPIQLSGGELQRAAIARALTLEPDILLADEPTGNLDSATAMEIVKLLSEINKKGTTVIMATHNEDAVKALSKRVISLNNGILTGGNEKKPKPHLEHSEKKSAIIDVKDKKSEDEDF